MRASMVVTYYIEFFRTGVDRHNALLIPFLLLVAETIEKDYSVYQEIKRNGKEG